MIIREKSLFISWKQSPRSPMCQIGFQQMAERQTGCKRTGNDTELLLLILQTGRRVLGIGNEAPDGVSSGEIN